MSEEHVDTLTIACSELAEIERERDELRARLAEVEAALLQGGQTAQIRCNAALLALDGWTTKPPSAAAAGDRADARAAAAGDLR